MRLGKNQDDKEQRKTSPWETANKAIVWGRNILGAAGAGVLTVKVIIPKLLKDVVKK